MDTKVNVNMEMDLGSDINLDDLFNAFEVSNPLFNNDHALTPIPLPIPSSKPSKHSNRSKHTTNLKEDKNSSSTITTTTPTFNTNRTTHSTSSKLSKDSNESFNDIDMEESFNLNDPNSHSFLMDLNEIKKASLFLNASNEEQVQVMDEFQFTTEKVIPMDSFKSSSSSTTTTTASSSSSSLPPQSPTLPMHVSCSSSDLNSNPLPSPTSSTNGTLTSVSKPEPPHPSMSTTTPNKHDLVGSDAELKFSKSHIATRHEVVLPPNFDKSTYIPIMHHQPPSVWARTYPFTLDPFQEYSIYCIQRSESVLVAAHTSAGKTVVAEYAIAQALKNKQRVIYTSPIKALSNQKYRELLEEFADVGLMTGDVTINPRASCLVMTTEILRSMLYKGSEILREISWVVYDEIHYMRDKERGVVWEETLILLPPTVHFVFLSATIPNAKQFAQWICKIHKQPCHVVYTDYRPTPLQHYLFPANSPGIHLVVDEKGTFKEENFQKAMQTLAPAEEEVVTSGPKKKKKRPSHEKSDILKLIRMIMQKNFHPVIVFSFSKKECEAHALDMSKLDFNQTTEKELVDTVFHNAINQLNEDDQNLPQITGMLPILRRGIGVHHSGLLPILKETIEILFQEGLIKVLFATETFSIGLNMPAKTVVFTKIEKFDGNESRYLTGGEYIQMSGRAGRRGLDDKGIVIMMIDQKIDVEKAKSMVKGEANSLISAFRLGYNMLLNLIRVEGVSPEYLIQNSFRQFQSNSKLPILLESVEELEQVYAELDMDDEESIRSYYIARYRLDQYTQDVRDVISDPLYALPFVKEGRLVEVYSQGMDFGWGVIINALKRQKPYGVEKETAHHIVLDVALLVDPSTKSETQIEALRPPSNLKQSELIVLPVLLSTIASFSSFRLHTKEFNLKYPDGRRSLQKALIETLQRITKSHGKMPTLDPVEDMGIKSKKFKHVLEKIQHYESLIAKHPLVSQPEVLKEKYNLYLEKLKLSEKIKALRKEIKASQALLQHDELKARKRVLRRLGFTNEEDIVQLKGRVACEISTSDPLLLTEMLFHGVFTDLTVDQCVALLGVFTFLERSKDSAQAKQTLRDELSTPLQVLLEIAKRIAQVSKECNLDFDETEYLDSFKPDLMEVVYAWSKGAKFSQICKMTDVFEGNLVRSFRLLEELLRQMTNAAKTIGNQDLEIKFSEGITKIKRDIIFANSLYL